MHIQSGAKKMMVFHQWNAALCVNLHSSVCVCMYVNTSLGTHIYIYIYIYIHTHTHKHTHTNRRQKYDGVPPMECRLMCQSAFMVCEGIKEWEGRGNKNDRQAHRDSEHVKLVLFGREVPVPRVQTSWCVCMWILWYTCRIWAFLFYSGVKSCPTCANFMICMYVDNVIHMFYSGVKYLSHVCKLRDMCVCVCVCMLWYTQRSIVT